MPDLHNLSPSDILNESLSRRFLAEHLNNPEKVDAFFGAAVIAVRAVLRAGAAGNVQCQHAEKEMRDMLEILLKK